jgi:hypothetical protein
LRDLKLEVGRQATDGEGGKPSATKTAFLGELGLACRMDGVAWERRNTFWDAAS